MKLLGSFVVRDVVQHLFLEKSAAEVDLNLEAVLPLEQGRVGLINN